jgi:hypothetical protein
MTRPPLPLQRRLSPHTHGLGDVAMLTDYDLQRMYELADGLHPHPGIALAVTLEACERLTLVRRLHDRRTGRYRLRLPEARLPHYCVYLASEAGERDQECPLQGETPVYRPTPDDYLVRYLKCLVWRTMDRNASHVAVALGCFLYGFQPSDMASLAPEVFHYHNIRCEKQRLAKQLKTRLQGVPMFRDGPPTLRTRPPTAHDRQLVHRALTIFTPWGASDDTSPAPTLSLLDTHFGWASVRSEWDQIHALINPTGGGLPRLIREYIASFPPGSDVRMEDPEHALGIPCFHP